ncbi:uncharacterized protein [Nicotiana tomentosiformis]|uniref:uncharacterized protein n=1 Tax=Nicotiana tomentosiformis TaxID=4098 RepID=UPI00388CB5FE
MRGRAHLQLPFPSWKEYVWALLDRFGAEFDDPMSELVKLRQTGGVVEFQESFDRAMTRLNLEPSYAISIFLEGLKPELGDAPNQFLQSNRPSTSLANNLPKPNQSVEFLPGHVCKNKAHLYLLELVEDFEILEELGDELLKVEEVAETCEISIHALQGTQGYKTIRLMGYSHRKPFNILIDNASTQNFMDSTLVAKMGWRVDPCNLLDANLADGTCDMVLGVQWLSTLGDIIFNFKQLTMKFDYEGKIVSSHEEKDEKMLGQNQLGSSRCYKNFFMQHQLYARKTKCQFAVASVEYLGHFISAEGVVTDPKKIQAVQQWPTPITVKQLREFLGLAGYYRRFIREYGHISKPLIELLRKDHFKWNDQATAAFQDLKDALTSAPVLALPNFSLPFMVEIDAYDIGIGVVIMQSGQPIAYLSKGMSPQHQAISVYDKELLALVMAVTKWGQYLIERHFVVKTDQKALKFLLDQKLHTGAQIKWITKLTQFDFEIQYKKGKENKVADALSRLPTIEIAALTLSSVRIDLLQTIKDNWNTDPELTTLIQQLQAHKEEVKRYSYITQQLRIKRETGDWK